MADKNVRFIRINGRVIPIARSARQIATGVALTRIKKPETEVKTRTGFKAISTGLSIASGILSGATLSGGVKTAVGAFAGSFGLDVAGSAANVAAHAGRDNKKDRIKAAARYEGYNFLIGNAAFVGTALAIPKQRKALVTGIKTTAAMIGKLAMKLRGF